MKVLMFGWEFPPNISGGLGTACHGLVKGLSTMGNVDIAFVVPKVYGNEESDNVRLIAAVDISLTGSRIIPGKTGCILDYIEVNSRLVPYVDPDSYSDQVCFTVEGINS